MSRLEPSRAEDPPDRVLSGVAPPVPEDDGEQGSGDDSESRHALIHAPDRGATPVLPGRSCGEGNRTLVVRSMNPDWQANSLPAKLGRLRSHPLYSLGLLLRALGRDTPRNYLGGQRDLRP